MTAPSLPLAAPPIAVGSPGDYVLDLVVTSGGMIVAATSGGGVVAVDAATTAVASLGRHAAGVSAVCVDEGRGLILSASLDGTVASWDHRTAPGSGPAAR
jgi:hypothetical protein